MIASQPLGQLVACLAARTPTPGGGAAAAATAALGCAAGAMAARYTTGPKWADRSAEAEALAAWLDQQAQQVLTLADEDERAFAAAQAARKAKDDTARAIADQRAAAIPLEVMALCAEAHLRLAEFAPRCNPQLLSDVRVGQHLLRGAAHAAWATALANQPPPAVQAQGTAILGRIG